MTRPQIFRLEFAAVLFILGCTAETPPATPVSTPAEQASIPQPAAAENATDPTAASVDEAATPFVLEDGFQALTLADFDAFGAEAETWTTRDDRIVSTGKPKGYLYSKRPYQNFTWRLEFRYPRPKSLKDEEKFKGNTGFLVYITGDHKLWPVCLEVQGKHIQMAEIRPNGGAEPVTLHDDEAKRLTARQPVGQWNRLEIVSRNGAISVTLNETPVSNSEPNFLSEGLIGIQAEDQPFELRRMRIRAE